jgi:hypothetical protein
MARAETRMMKAIAADRITIWCSEPADFRATVDPLIAQGAFDESDRPRCIHWSGVKPSRELRHENWTDILDADEALGQARAGRTPKSLAPRYRPRGRLFRGRCAVRRDADRQARGLSKHPRSPAPWPCRVSL